MARSVTQEVAKEVRANEARLAPKKKKKKMSPVAKVCCSEMHSPSSHFPVGSMAAMSCAEMSDAVESIFIDGWTDAPALRAVPEDRRERLESALESLLASHDRTRAVVSGGARVVPLGGGERPGTSGGRDPVTPPRGSDGATGSGADAFAQDSEAIPDAVLSEHFGFLQMLHRQLLNAVAEFRPGRDADAPEFAYADETNDVVGTTGAAGDDGDGAAEREDGVLGKVKSDAERRSERRRRRRKRRLVVPAAGLSRHALEDVANAAQWIASVSEGASRVHRVALASRAAPDAWADGVPTNAKDAVGVRLYSDLNEDADTFDPEKVADAEGFFGGRVAWRWTETGGHASASATTARSLRDDDDDDDDDACAGDRRGDDPAGSGRSSRSRSNAEGTSREGRVSDDEPDGSSRAGVALAGPARARRARVGGEEAEPDGAGQPEDRERRRDRGADAGPGAVRNGAREGHRAPRRERRRPRRNRARAVPGGAAHVPSRLQDGRRARRRQRRRRRRAGAFARCLAAVATALGEGRTTSWPRTTALGMRRA